MAPVADGAGLDVRGPGALGVESAARAVRLRGGGWHLVEHSFD